MNFIIREMLPVEYPLLSDFLYEAIFQRDENNLLLRSVINEPSLKIYIEGFGEKEHDYCICAEVNGKVIGAVWTRCIRGYGSIHNDVPEFAISLFKDFRGSGIGTALMKSMLEHLNNKGYKEVSLAVQKDNYALRMYQKVGFRIVGENEEEYLMLYTF